jgi:iron complex transport system substrate-binding protein
MAFLYDTLIQEFGKRAIAQVTVPDHITDNLRSEYGQRPYQLVGPSLKYHPFRSNSKKLPFRPYILFCLFIYIGILSCSPSAPKEDKLGLKPLPLSYAQGFKIFQGEGFKILEVTQAYPGEHEPLRYLVIEKEGLALDQTNYDGVVSLPVEDLVLTSTTQVPHLDLLGISSKMIGFPNTDLISSESMRKQIDQGKVTDLGKGPMANIEMMVDLDPGLVVLSTLGENLEQWSILEKAGIPLILNGEYTEQDPLGRAEWIKFTGASTGKYSESLAVFEEIENAYLSLKNKTSAIPNDKKPRVVSGIMYKDIWYAPAAENWSSLFFKDAGADYVFKNEQGTGSLQLNYEYVLEKALQADIWIGAADFENLAAMKKTDDRYSNFRAFQQGEVYTYTQKRGATGGFEYFELGYMRPDIILKDLIKIFHPEQLPEYEPYFYKKLK